MQQATGSMQQTTDNVAKTACNGQQTGRKYTPGGLRHAADTAQKTTQQTTGNGQRETHAADNGQQTADDMQEDASTCEMQQEPHCTAAFRARRAADNQQHARGILRGNQCATRHRRHTQDATYDPCRNMQQTHMKIHGVRRTKSGGSRTSGLRRAHSLRWTLGAASSSLSAKVESSFDKLFAPTAESRFTLFRLGDLLTFR